MTRGSSLIAWGAAGAAHSFGAKRAAATRPCNPVPNVARRAHAR